MAQELKNSSRLLFTDEARKGLMFQRCCLCGINCVMTTEQYIFRKFGSFVRDQSCEGLTIKQNPEWICPDCAEEIIRIKNL